MALRPYLKEIADAIREKDGTTEPIPAPTFPERIRAIESGGGDFAVPLIVEVAAGSTVTATNEDITLVSTAGADHTANFILTKGGTWSVSGVLDGEETKTVSVEVTSEYRAKLVYIKGEVVKVASTLELNGASFTAGLIEDSYIMFNNNSSKSYTTIIDKTLVKTTASDYVVCDNVLANGCYNDKFALFGGRILFSSSTGKYTFYNFMYGWDAQLVQTKAPNRSVGGNSGFSCYFNHCAFFGGGASSFTSGTGSSAHYNYNSTCDRYDNTLTKTIMPNLNAACSNAAAAATASYLMVFGGFRYSGGTVYNNTITVYNADFTKLDFSTVLDAAVASPGATNVNQYIICAGGVSSVYYNTVVAFDENLTKISTMSPLSIAKAACSALSINNFALFAGGEIASSKRTSVVDGYNATLDKVEVPALSGEAFFLPRGVLGDYAFLCGGNVTLSAHSKDVNIYTVE